MGYASLGIPLTLVYLSSAGGLLSRCARGVFTRALCCCLCSNCGYCCYDERRMQVSDAGMLYRKCCIVKTDKKFNRRLPAIRSLFLFLSFKQTVSPNKPDICDERCICRTGSTYAPPVSAGYACPVRSIRINRYRSIDWLLLERYSNKIGSAFETPGTRNTRV